MNTGASEREGLLACHNLKQLVGFSPNFKNAWNPHLPLISKRVSSNLGGHSLLIESTQLPLIVDLDELLAASSGERDVQLRETWCRKAWLPKYYKPHTNTANPYGGNWQSLKWANGNMQLLDLVIRPMFRLKPPSWNYYFMTKQSGSHNNPEIVHQLQYGALGVHILQRAAMFLRLGRWKCRQRWQSNLIRCVNSINFDIEPVAVKISIATFSVHQYDFKTAGKRQKFELVNDCTFILLNRP